MNVYVDAKYINQIQSHLADSFPSVETIQFITQYKPSENIQAVVFGLDDKIDLFKEHQQKFIICTETEVSLAAVSQLTPAKFYAPEQIVSLVHDLIQFLQKQPSLSLNIQSSAKALLQNNIYSLRQQLLEKSEALQSFVVEENQKKTKEKKLLYFLDFLNAEQNKAEFIDHLCVLLWNDLKKMGSFFSLGFVVSTESEENTLICFNGQELDFKYNIQFSYQNEKVAAGLLATALQRPLGQTRFWVSNKNQSRNYFYLENRTSTLQIETLDAYLSERIDLMMLMIQRHIIQLKTSYLLNKWNLFGRAYSHPMHVVDDAFNLVRSNYHDGKTVVQNKCYEVLAKRDFPCLNCPLLAPGNSFVNINNERYKAYATHFFTDKSYHFIFYDEQSELDLLKSKMIQNEKMQVIGQLANHLAHELNNPLTGLKLATEFILQQPENSDLSVRSDFQEVLKGLMRCQNIISDLIDFSDESDAQLQVGPVQDVVKKTIPLLKSITRSHHIFIDLKSVNVKMNMAHLQQVLFNLIKNSCEAIAEKGVIKIYDIDFDKHYDVFCEDNGSGLPESIQAALFQPFATTKTNGEGTGLGLYISKNLMTRMGAQLIYDQQFGKQANGGTRFILRFNK